MNADRAETGANHLPRSALGRLNHSAETSFAKSDGFSAACQTERLGRWCPGSMFTELKRGNRRESQVIEHMCQMIVQPKQYMYLKYIITSIPFGR